MSIKKRCLSDFSDKEWDLIADFMKADPSVGALPKNLPFWNAVYMQFLRWRNNGKMDFDGIREVIIATHFWRGPGLWIVSHVHVLIQADPQKSYDIHFSIIVWKGRGG